MRYEIRPLGTWTEPVTDPRRSANVFRASWESTLEMLGYEAEQLGAELVVVQVDANEDDVRLDGMLRARAKVGFPGVRVSFTSCFGPLTYATDAYDRVYAGDLPGWQANVRAIALALQALRAVDRYGVSRRGEQYTGWRAIAAGAAAAPAKPNLTADEAARALADAAGSGWSVEEIITDPQVRARALRSAARRYHPDRAGGNAAVFAVLTEARDLLDRLDLRQA